MRRGQVTTMQGLILGLRCATVSATLTRAQAALFQISTLQLNGADQSSLRSCASHARNNKHWWTTSHNPTCRSRMFDMVATFGTRTDGKIVQWHQAGGSHPVRTVPKSIAAVLLGTAVVASPALAKNGNGNGNGQSAGKSANAASNMSASANDSSASKLGALNGFMHASPSALAHASAKSEIGKVAVVYAGLLQNYLSPQPGSTPPTLAQVAAALAAAANKPPSANSVEAVNTKLESINPTLAQLISAYSGGPSALAAAIYQAI
ncbi:hypothetical protein ACFX5Q_18110 [Mesorhizobium sp. IMUNJ 23033]|uniref:hypothetical protein n=1 Tax=Mesorhizobium sp. IMUNJ 23033 TaxID=3378039 RepID=UPI003850A7F7